jgi:hypothetical protein
MPHPFIFAKRIFLFVFTIILFKWIFFSYFSGSKQSHLTNTSLKTTKIIFILANSDVFYLIYFFLQLGNVSANFIENLYVRPLFFIFLFTKTSAPSHDSSDKLLFKLIFSLWAFLYLLSVFVSRAMIFFLILDASVRNLNSLSIL